MRERFDCEIYENTLRCRKCCHLNLKEKYERFLVTKMIENVLCCFLIQDRVIRYDRKLKDLFFKLNQMGKFIASNDAICQFIQNYLFKGKEIKLVYEIPYFNKKIINRRKIK